MWGMDILRESTGQQLGLTLLHFLWQGILIAILLWGVVHLFRLKRGNQRYAAYLVGFLILLACPVVTFFTVDVEQINRMSRRAKLITDMQAELQKYESYEKSTSSPVSDDKMIGMGWGRSADLTRATVRLRDRAAMYADTAQPWIIGAWIVGMTAFGLRMICGLIGIVRWCRKLQPLPVELEPRIDRLGERMKLDRPIRICLSDRVKQAMAVGCLRPMIILPMAMITHMPVELLEAIIAHELAHIRRHDLWINLLQRMAEILFFFHPAMWWISKNLRRERELCCDELAARTIGERATYAEALEKVSRAILYTKEPAFAAAVGQRKKTILSRVQHVLGLTGTPSHSWQAVMVIFFLALIVLPLTAWALTVMGPSRILYVDDDAAPGGGGTSWADAYKYLQDALDETLSGDEIRVAQGTYKPDQGGGETPGNREATFALKNGVALMGGFAGPGTVDPDARDPNQYETILSGDLLGNDVTVADPYNLPDEPTRAENSHHVVTGSGTNETAVIDGFTLTAGNAHGNFGPLDPKLIGGGMYNYSGSPTVVKCIFRANSADWAGGGMVNLEGSDPTVTECRFIKNAVNVLIDGIYYSIAGGMGNAWNSNPVLTTCSFIDNFGGHYGGGIVNIYDCSPTITDCVFSRNRVVRGSGGMMNDYSSHAKVSHCIFNHNEGSGLGNFHASCPEVESCVFYANTAERGAGMANRVNSHSMVRNCLFYKNSATEKGGGMWNGDGSDPQIINCTFVNNDASISGGGIWNGTYATSDSSNPTLVNCILWDNSPQEIMDDVGVSTVSYSDIEGGWPGVGNIVKDPCFVDPTNGDYHLKSQVGHWDSNGNSWVCDGVTSLCIDAGDPTSDYAAELWPHGGCVNMGAYGNTPEASMSSEVIGNIADLNHDGMVNLDDYSFWVMNWMKEEILLAADLDRNGKVDMPDALMFFDNWLWEE